jgi:type VI protein secretion system component Hcp
MPSMPYARSRRTLPRCAAAVALLGGAGALAFASPAAARLVPAQVPALSGPFKVSLVLPTTTGVATPTSTNTAGEQLSAFSLSTTGPASVAGTTGLGAGKASVGASQATATMPIDTTSTNLLEDVLESHILSQVMVVFQRSVAGKEATFLTYDFKNCTITSYQLQDGPGTQSQATSGAPSVQITFVFQGLSLSYGKGASTLGTGATVPAGWDITANKSA